MNAWSVTEHTQKRNDKIALYSSVNIKQFNWLFNPESPSKDELWPN